MGVGIGGWTIALAPSAQHFRDPSFTGAQKEVALVAEECLQESQPGSGNASAAVAAAAAAARWNGDYIPGKHTQPG